MAALPRGLFVEKRREVTLKPPASNQEKILIVEDDSILSKFLQSYLARHGFQVDCLPDGESIPVYLGKNRVDLVVLDLLLPGRDGIYWLKWLRQYHPNVRVILTSGRFGEDDRLLGLESGAMDYLIKPFHDKELLIRIRNVLRQQFIIRDEKVIRLGDVVIDLYNHTVVKDSESIHLTALEANILKLLYLNCGAYISREEIMLQVKGASYHPLDRSIDIHINKLRKKIETDPANPVYIRTIRGKGYGFHLDYSVSTTYT